MCRILFISGKQSGSFIEKALLNFQELAETGKVPTGIIEGHKDGWGIIAYKKGEVVFFLKKPTNASKDKLFQKSISKIILLKPDFVIAHLRKSSVGKLNLNNTHPFLIQNWSFCHNGTIFNKEKIILDSQSKKLIKGETDSEKFFVSFLQSISFSQSISFLMLKSKIKKMIEFVKKNSDYTSLNFILSNGKTTLALREINTSNKMVKEKNLLNYYTLYQGMQNNKLAIVCSEKLPLSKVSWKNLKNHECVQAH